jgi:hypothetical protein
MSDASSESYIMRTTKYWMADIMLMRCPSVYLYATSMDIDGTITPADMMVLEVLSPKSLFI